MVLASLDRVLTPFVRDPDAIPDPRSRPADAVPDALARLLEALLAFAGLAAESMVRDPGWHLLDAGRRLERALQVTGLLRACLSFSDPAAEELIMESVLTCTESIITHRRRYPGRSGVDTVLALLLSDRGNPRSVAFQLEQLQRDLTQLPADTEPARLARQRTGELLGMVRAIPSGVADFLNLIASQLLEVSELIDKAHFSHPAPLQSLGEFALVSGGGQL
jgi:uncharacterized alpha-E superfamily protein